MQFDARSALKMALAPKAHDGDMDKEDRRGLAVAVALGAVLPTAVALTLLLWLSWPRPIVALGAAASSSWPQHSVARDEQE